MSLTIIEAPVATKLTTRDVVKGELGLTGSGQDDYLDRLIDQASAAITSWCSRVFAAETVRETFHAGFLPREAFVLSRWPVIDLLSIEIAGQAQPLAETEQEAGGLLYRVDAGGNRACWPAGRTVIIYRAGYVLPGEDERTLPPDIERATLLTVRAAWHAAGRDPLLRSETIEGVGSSAYFGAGASGLSAEVEGLLTPYRVVGVA